ncbi:hypothetical protein Dip518_000366 [Parelusimicrobium proximum]|uniref:type IV pilin protein n=1 Tax=Parelusimicrobium proximum TaxID=3228953 RepID=UPI003D17B401
MVYDNKKGFTLVEITLVVILIVVLTSLSVPVFQRAVERSRSTEASTVLNKIRSEQEKKYSFGKGSYAEDFAELRPVIQGKGRVPGKVVEGVNYKYHLRKLDGVEFAEAVPNSKYQYTIRTSGYANTNLCATGADADIVKALYKGCAGCTEDPCADYCNPCGSGCPKENTCQCNKDQAACCDAAEYWTGSSCNACPPDKKVNLTKTGCECINTGDSCSASGGVWDSSACACACEDGAPDASGACPAKQSSCPEDKKNACSSTGGTWDDSECTCSCATVGVNSNGECPCSDKYKNACKNSKGYWRSYNCSCFCPDGSPAGPDGQCVLKCPYDGYNNCVYSETYGDWDWDSCSCSCYGDAELTGDKCVCPADPKSKAACTEDRGEWDDSSCECWCTDGSPDENGICPLNCEDATAACESTGGSVDRYCACTCPYGKKLNPITSECEEDENPGCDPAEMRACNQQGDKWNDEFCKCVSKYCTGTYYGSWKDDYSAEPTIMDTCDGDNENAYDGETSGPNNGCVDVMREQSTGYYYEGLTDLSVEVYDADDPEVARCRAEHAAGTGVKPCGDPNPGCHTYAEVWIGEYVRSTPAPSISCVGPGQDLVYSSAYLSEAPKCGIPEGGVGTYKVAECGTSAGFVISFMEPNHACSIRKQAGECIIDAQMHPSYPCGSAPASLGGYVLKCSPKVRIYKMCGNKIYHYNRKYRDVRVCE